MFKKSVSYLQGWICPVHKKTMFLIHREIQVKHDKVIDELSLNSRKLDFLL